MLKRFILVALLLGAFSSEAWAVCTDSTYPTSLEAFTPKIAGDQLTVADVNQIRCAIEQIQIMIGATGSVKFATLAGLGSNQTLNGATTASGSLTLSSTAHATKGVIIFGAASGFDELNQRLGIGVLLPQTDIDIQKTGAASIQQTAAGATEFSSFVGNRARNTIASPQTVQSTDVLVDLQGKGHDGSNFVFSTSVRGVAIETWSGSQRGSQIEFHTIKSGTTSITRTALLSAGYGLGFDAGSSFINLTEEAANPGDPADGAGAIVYVKGDKLIIKYNDASTIRFKYLDLTGTGVTWTHTTTPP